MTSSYRPAPGRFLISEPFMEDENFQRTVVLLVEHGPNGSLGFVLNRMMKSVVADIVSDLSPVQSPLFLGGPVEQDSLHYVHRLGDQIPESREIYPGLYWGGDFDTVKASVISQSASESDILFFVGYSGWAPGQLSRELHRKAWIVAPENTSFIFREDHEGLWKDLLRSMGSKYQVISNYPIDPRLN